MIKGQKSVVQQSDLLLFQLVVEKLWPTRDFLPALVLNDSSLWQQEEARKRQPPETHHGYLKNETS
jgi:hypothetical protein